MNATLPDRSQISFLEGKNENDVIKDIIELVKNLRNAGMTRRGISELLNVHEAQIRLFLTASSTEASFRFKESQGAEQLESEAPSVEDELCACNVSER